MSEVSNKKKYSNEACFALILLSYLFGIYIFFQNTSIEENFIQYLEFSQSIFKPHNETHAESILLPLIANLTGANHSMKAYQMLCAVIFINFFPLLAYVSLRVFNDFFKSFAYLAIFIFSFKYLWTSYTPGFPDPLTLTFLTVVSLTANPLLVSICVFFAGLSHYSSTAVAATVMVLMLVAYSLPNFHQHNRRIKFLFVGLFASYLVLHLWYQVFSYKFFSRFDYVLTNGFEFFLKRYDQSVIAFWLTPGIGFLLIYASLMIYFLFLKKYIFSLSAVISVMAAYAALFFTTDGVRIFSLAIAPSYSLMLRYGIVNAFDQYNNQTTPKTKAKITAFSLKAGLIIFWCTVIIYAQGFGLIINVWPQQLKSEQAAVLFNYFIALLGIIVFAISLGARKKDPWLLHYLLKLLLFTPLIAIVLQVSRLALIPDYSLNLFQKSILVGLIMIVADQLSRAPMDALVRNVAFKYRQFSIWYRTL